MKIRGKTPYFFDRSLLNPFSYIGLNAILLDAIYSNFQKYVQKDLVLSRHFNRNVIVTNTIIVRDVNGGNKGKAQTLLPIHLERGKCLFFFMNPLS